MLKVMTAPNVGFSLDWLNFPSLFLAGGITNCPDWQSNLIHKLEYEMGEQENLIIYNPRRKNFPIGDQTAAEEQICWEYVMLRNSRAISFWFSCGSDNPIVLYELGMWANSRKGRQIFVGMDPDYSRRGDVILQTQLAYGERGDPLPEFVYTLDNLMLQIVGWLVTDKMRKAR